MEPMNFVRIVTKKKYLVVVLVTTLICQMQTHNLNVAFLILIQTYVVSMNNVLLIVGYFRLILNYHQLKENMSSDIIPLFVKENFRMIP